MTNPILRSILILILAFVPQFLIDAIKDIKAVWTEYNAQNLKAATKKTSRKRFASKKATAKKKSAPRKKAASKKTIPAKKETAPRKRSSSKPKEQTLAESQEQT